MGGIAGTGGGLYVVCKENCMKDNNSEFTCGNCVNNDDGFCDFIGILVDDEDEPHCSYGKGWECKNSKE